MSLDEGELVSIPDSVVREQVDALAKHMETCPRVDLPVTHRFARGLYARELFIPKGVIAIGKIHKYGHISIFSKGRISVMDEQGIVIEITAPFSMVSIPGVRRVAYAHEDTVWTTVHATDITDIEKIEEEFIAKSFEDVPALEAQVNLLMEKLT